MDHSAQLRAFANGFAAGSLEQRGLDAAAAEIDRLTDQVKKLKEFAAECVRLYVETKTGN